MQIFPFYTEISLNFSQQRTSVHTSGSWLRPGRHYTTSPGRHMLLLDAQQQRKTEFPSWTAKETLNDYIMSVLSFYSQHWAFTGFTGSTKLFRKWFLKLVQTCFTEAVTFLFLYECAKHVIITTHLKLFISLFIKHHISMWFINSQRWLSCNQ